VKLHSPTASLSKATNKNFPLGELTDHSHKIYSH